jgi:serine/threonine protein kinase
MTLVPGQLLDGKYRIVRILGQGAMGAVFEGENTRIRRRVAIKVLHPAVAERAELARRFEREAQAAGRIGSAHIVEVLDLGELADGTRYLVMEFLDGVSLRSRIPKRRSVAPFDVLPLLRQLLVGLGAAHQAGIVHRDLKPDNVFVLNELAGQRDFVKLVDFGVSKFESVEGDEGDMTRTGIVMGTPYYMSPEQARGSRDVDARSDLFSVGVILYEAVTGRVPFEGETFNELMFKIALEDAPAPESLVPDLDIGVCRILRRALARDASQRFQTASEFVDAIDEWLASGRTSVIAPAPADVALEPPPDGTIVLDEVDSTSERGALSLDATETGRTLLVRSNAPGLAPTVGSVRGGAPPSAAPASRPWRTAAMIACGATILVAGAWRYRGHEHASDTIPSGLSSSARADERSRWGGGDSAALPPQSLDAAVRGLGMTSASASPPSVESTVQEAPGVASAKANAAASIQTTNTAPSAAPSLPPTDVAAGPARAVVAPANARAAARPSAAPPSSEATPAASGRRVRTF